MAIAPGTHTMALDAEDGCDPDGNRADTFSLEVPAGQAARVWMRSDAFDTFLQVTRPDGSSFDNDDFGSGVLHSAVQWVSAEAGTYTITARGYSPTAEGAYTLGVSLLEPGDGPNLAGAVDETRSLGDAGFGTLAPAASAHWIYATGGERIRARVTSTEFDTVAILLGPTGQSWTNDDANDVGDGSERLIDSTIDAHLGIAGWYHLLVVPYEMTGGGTYRVRTTMRDPVSLVEGATSPAEGYAGTDGEGRVLGLFAGISDYPGEDSDLYGCADDATLLARAFRERGLQSEGDQIVITDSQVTTDGLLTGLSEIASRSTTNDVVVLFYSGHGDQVASPPNGTELDGTDETLAIYDSEITDDQFMAAVDAIEANTILLVIDACHSGGFARDFMTAPNRIGVFSSDEDVLSDTAEPVFAGGYLSYYMREAVLGGADARPEDGAITSGELTDYLYSGFVDSYSDMNPGSSTSPLQRLVVSRGARGWHDTLWIHPRSADGTPRQVEVSLRSAPPEERLRAAGRCE